MPAAVRCIGQQCIPLSATRWPDPSKQTTGNSFCVEILARPAVHSCTSTTQFFENSGVHPAKPRDSRVREIALENKTADVRLIAEFASVQRTHAVRRSRVVRALVNPCPGRGRR